MMLQHIYGKTGDRHAYILQGGLKVTMLTSPAVLTTRLFDIDIAQDLPTHLSVSSLLAPSRSDLAYGTTTKNLPVLAEEYALPG